jgi:hypothetical protein
MADNDIIYDTKTGTWLRQLSDGSLEKVDTTPPEVANKNRVVSVGHSEYPPQKFTTDNITPVKPKGERINPYAPIIIEDGVERLNTEKFNPERYAEINKLNQPMKPSSTYLSRGNVPIPTEMAKDAKDYHALQDKQYADSLINNPEKNVGVSEPINIKKAADTGAQIIAKEGEDGGFKGLIEKIKRLKLSPAEEATVVEDSKSLFKKNPKLVLGVVAVAGVAALMSGGFSGVVDYYNKMDEDPKAPPTPPPAAAPSDSNKKVTDNKKPYEVPKTPLVLMDQSGKVPPVELKEPEAPKLKDFEQTLEPTNFPSQADYDPNNVLGTPIDESKFKLADFTNATKDLKDALGKAYGEYATEKNAIKQKQLWESIIHGLGYLAAGVYGMKSGVNMGGLKFEPSDWASQYNSAKDMLDAASNNAKSVFQANKEGIEQSNKQIELNYKALIDNKSAVASAYGRALDNAKFDANQKEDTIRINNAAVENSNRNALNKYGIKSASYDKQVAAQSAAEKAALDRDARLELKKLEVASKTETQLNKVKDTDAKLYKDLQMKDLDKLSNSLKDYDKPKADKTEIALSIKAALDAKGIDTTKAFPEGWIGRVRIDKGIMESLIEEKRKEVLGMSAGSGATGSFVSPNDTPKETPSKTGDGEVLLSYPDGTHAVKDKNGNIIHARQ